MSFSVECDSYGRVYINTASESALKTVEGMTPEIFAKIVQLRSAAVIDSSLASAVLGFTAEFQNLFNFEYHPGSHSSFSLGTTSSLPPVTTLSTH